MQNQVYNDIGLKPAHYNKPEKGLIEYSIKIPDKLAMFYDVTIDKIVHFSKAKPQAVTIKNKSDIEPLRLISKLNGKDKGTVMNIIDTILTKQEFQTFFKQYLATK